MARRKKKGNKKKKDTENSEAAQDETGSPRGRTRDSPATSSPEAPSTTSGSPSTSTVPDDDPQDKDTIPIIDNTPRHDTRSRSKSPIAEFVHAIQGALQGAQSMISKTPTQEPLTEGYRPLLDSASHESTQPSHHDPDSTYVPSEPSLLHGPGSRTDEPVEQDKPSFKSILLKRTDEERQEDPTSNPAPDHKFDPSLSSKTRFNPITESQLSKALMTALQSVTKPASKSQPESHLELVVNPLTSPDEEPMTSSVVEPKSSPERPDTLEVTKSESSDSKSEFSFGTIKSKPSPIRMQAIPEHLEHTPGKFKMVDTNPKEFPSLVNVQEEPDDGLGGPLKGSAFGQPEESQSTITFNPNSSASSEIIRRSTEEIQKALTQVNNSPISTEVDLLAQTLTGAVTKAINDAISKRGSISTGSQEGTTQDEHAQTDTTPSQPNVEDNTPVTTNLSTTKPEEIGVGYYLQLLDKAETYG